MRSCHQIESRLAVSAVRARLHSGEEGRAGWYLLQQMNFEAGIHLAGLSEYYVVWDADTLPTSSDLKFFDDATGKVIFYLNDECFGCPPAVSYRRSVELLTGLRVEHPWGRNFVAHFMVFKRSWSRAVIHHVAAWRGVRPEEWGSAAIEVTKDPYLHQGVPGKIASYGSGFADYELLGTWVSAFHPEAVLYNSEWWTTKHIRVQAKPSWAAANKGSCLPPIHRFKKWQDLYYTVTLELHKFDKSCTAEGSSPTSGSLEMAVLRPWLKETFAPDAARNVSSSSGPAFQLSAPPSEPSACTQQWQLRGGLWPKGMRARPSKGKERPVAHTRAEHLKGAYYTPMAEDNVAVYLYLTPASTATVLGLASLILSLRHPQFGNWSGPIITIIDGPGKLVLQWMASSTVQNWMRCSERPPAIAARKALPVEYDPPNNPCAVSFVGMAAGSHPFNGIGIHDVAFKRSKAAVHEVLDLENARRTHPKALPAARPPIEYALFVDTDSNVMAPLSTLINSWSQSYTGQAMSLFRQPSKPQNMDPLDLELHGGLWLTHLYLGRNFSREWRRMMDLQWLQGIRLKDQVTRLKEVRDQPPLTAAARNLYRRFGAGAVKYVGHADLAVHLFPHLEQFWPKYDNISDDAQIPHPADTPNLYPLMPGADSDKKSVVLHWGGLTLGRYAEWLLPTYEEAILKLGAPDALPHINGKDKASIVHPVLDPKIAWRVNDSMRQTSTYPGDHDFVWMRSLHQGSAPPPVVILDREGAERVAASQLAPLIDALLRVVKPMYILVPYFPSDDADFCAKLNDVTWALDERLCEPPLLQPQVMQRGDFRGGLNEAEVAQRRVLCMWNTREVNNRKTGLRFVRWPLEMLPLQALHAEGAGLTRCTETRGGKLRRLLPGEALPTGQIGTNDVVCYPRGSPPPPSPPRGSPPPPPPPPSPLPASPHTRRDKSSWSAWWLRSGRTRGSQLG